MTVQVYEEFHILMVTLFFKLHHGSPLNHRLLRKRYGASQFHIERGRRLGFP